GNHHRRLGAKRRGDALRPRRAGSLRGRNRETKRGERVRRHRRRRQHHAAAQPGASGRHPDLRLRRRFRAGRRNHELHPVPPVRRLRGAGGARRGTVVSHRRGTLRRRQLPLRQHRSPGRDLCAQSQAPGDRKAATQHIRPGECEHEHGRPHDPLEECQPSGRQPSTVQLPAPGCQRPELHGVAQCRRRQGHPDDAVRPPALLADDEPAVRVERRLQELWRLRSRGGLPDSVPLLADVHDAVLEQQRLRVDGQQPALPGLQTRRDVHPRPPGAGRNGGDRARREVVRSLPSDGADAERPSGHREGQGHLAGERLHPGGQCREGPELPGSRAPGDEPVTPGAAAMPRSRQILCPAYAAIAVLAFVGTWTENVSYFTPGEGPITGFVLATGRFWTATLATPASISIAVDLALFFVAAAVLMVIEARRLAIRWVWLYILLGFLVAISVTFPLFLIARERRIAAIGEGSNDLGLSRADLAALVVLAGLTAAITIWTLGQ